ncbi:MAG: tRNA (adenosine(37)-N6)-dimethylallyltransferase MiaA [Candidatus Marisimplicoccus sp.]
MTNKKLIYLAGPTGIGKTDISITLAEKLNTEIVSCDSRQFFKELKIGTSPPSKKQLKEIKHHFIHSKSIHDIYNAGLYEKDAIKVLNKLFKINDTVLLVGGSGLYADSIMYGIDDFPDIPVKIRDEIVKNYDLKGIEYIQNRLKLLDPDYYSEVDLKNTNRIIRALEIIEYTGNTFSSYRTNRIKQRDFECHIILIECEREKLYKRINNRVDLMLENGLEEEAYNLKDYKNLNTLDTVGYKEFFTYFENKISYKEAVEKIKQNTRNYAKRQITWNKKYSNVKKIDISENITENINKILQK